MIFDGIDYSNVEIAELAHYWLELVSLVCISLVPYQLCKMPTKDNVNLALSEECHEYCCL